MCRCSDAKCAFPLLHLLEHRPRVTVALNEKTARRSDTWPRTSCLNNNVHISLKSSQLFPRIFERVLSSKRTTLTHNSNTGLLGIFLRAKDALRCIAQHHDIHWRSSYWPPVIDLGSFFFSSFFLVSFRPLVLGFEKSTFVCYRAVCLFQNLWKNHFSGVSIHNWLVTRVSTLNWMFRHLTCIYARLTFIQHITRT